MQTLIVVLAVAGSVFFIGRRLWQTFRNPKNSSCGCGCSGCTVDDHCSPVQKTLSQYKP